MRTNFKKAMMPLAVVVLGAAAAFATNAAKQNEKSEVAMFGYHYDASQPAGNECQPLWVDCNTSSGPICTISEVTYYRDPIKNGLQCTEVLYLNVEP